MKRTTLLLSSCLATALAVGAMAGPTAAAAKGRVAFIQGQPGKVAELCINNREVKASFKYGGTMVTKLPPGPKAIKLRKKSAGTCTGKILAGKQLPVASDDDWVVVFTKLVPKVVTFDKTTKPYFNNGIVLRNASDIGTLGFMWDGFGSGNSWNDVATVGTTEFEKGDGEGGVTFGHVFWAHQVPNTGVVGQPFTASPPPGYHVDATVVGTNPFNARWVRLTLTNP